MKASSSLNGMIQEDEGSNGHITDGTLSSDAGECRRERRKQQQLRKSKRQTGTVPTKTFSPAVLVLLFGVFLSFLNVLRIMKNLEESPSYFNTASSSDINDIVPPIEAIGNDSDRTKDPLVGREPIVKIIMDAGISFNRIDDADLLQELPLWSEITSLYGSEPILHGLSEGNCQRFQEHSDKGEHLIGTAGTFNSGTNLLSELLIDNCMMPERMKKYGQKSRGIRWQVPWGKHSPAGDKQYREVHKTRKDKDIDANEIMPMVTIRDPLFWLKSMCRHHYTAYWHGIDEMHHCPNFSKKDLTAHVKYDGFVRKYNSLLDLWNQYYSEYMNIDIPVSKDIFMFATFSLRFIWRDVIGLMFDKNVQLFDSFEGFNSQV